MAHEAVRNAAIPSENRRDLLLEERRQWVVQVGGPRLMPEVLQDVGMSNSRLEERRHEAEPGLDGAEKLGRS